MEHYNHDIRIIRIIENGKMVAKWYIHDLALRKDIKGVFDSEKEAIKASQKIGRRK